MSLDLGLVGGVAENGVEPRSSSSSEEEKLGMRKRGQQGIMHFNKVKRQPSKKEKQKQIQKRARAQTFCTVHLFYSLRSLGNILKI